MGLLEVLIVVLLIAWLLGFGAFGVSGGGAIHILIVVVIVLVIVRLLQGRSVL